MLSLHEGSAKRIRQTAGTKIDCRGYYSHIAKSFKRKGYCYQDMWKFYTQTHIIFSIDFTFKD